MLPTIDQFNQLEKNEFLKTVNLLFETAPPLAEFLWKQRPFDSYDDLIKQAESAINQMDISDKLVVLNAHPRIGAPPKSLSQQSRIEQGTDADPLVLQTLEKLNKEYQEKFGFLFMVFVNGRSKSEIIPVLQQRLLNTRETELQTGLEAMILVARDRLSKLKSV